MHLFTMKQDIHILASQNSELMSCSRRQIRKIDQFKGFVSETRKVSDFRNSIKHGLTMGIQPCIAFSDSLKRSLRGL